MPLPPQRCLVSSDLNPSTRTTGVNTKVVEAQSKKLLEDELNQAASEVKESQFSLGLLDCTWEQLKDIVVDCGVSINASYSLRGWSAMDAVIAAISVDT